MTGLSSTVTTPLRTNSQKAFAVASTSAIALWAHSNLSQKRCLYSSFNFGGFEENPLHWSWQYSVEDLIVQRVFIGW